MCIFVRESVCVDHGSQTAGSILAFGKASVMRNLIFKFYYPSFPSDILVVSNVLSCAESIVGTSISAYPAGANAARRQDGFAVPPKT